MDAVGSKLCVKLFGRRMNQCAWLVPSRGSTIAGWVASAVWWALDQLTRLEARLGLLWLLCDHARSTRIVGGGNTLGIS